MHGQSFYLKIFFISICALAKLIMAVGDRFSWKYASYVLIKRGDKCFNLQYCCQVSRTVRHIFCQVIVYLTHLCEEDL